MSPNPKRFAGAVVVLLVVVFLMLMRKSKNTSVPIEEPQPTEPQVQILDKEAKKEETPQQDKDFMQKVAWDRTERQIDLKRMPLPIENGEAILDVDITTKGTCFPGDADAIAMDLKAVPDHKLLATLESLSQGGTSLSWDVPKDFVTKGIAANRFKLPVKKEPAQYGFYLCTALSSDKSCRSKAVRDVNEIFTAHVQKDPKAGQETRSIFFQYFLLDERGLSTFSSPPEGGQKFEALKKYVKEREMRGDFEKEIDVAKKNIQTLISFPIVFDDNKLKIELPKYSIEACARRPRK